jgi:hypothetical protein
MSRSSARGLASLHGGRGFFSSGSLSGFVSRFKDLPLFKGFFFALRIRSLRRPILSKAVGFMAFRRPRPSAGKAPRPGTDHACRLRLCASRAAARKRAATSPGNGVCQGTRPKANPAEPVKPPSENSRRPAFPVLQGRAVPLSAARASYGRPGGHYGGTRGGHPGGQRGGHPGRQSGGHPGRQRGVHRAGIPENTRRISRITRNGHRGKHAADIPENTRRTSRRASW